GTWGRARPAPRQRKAHPDAEAPAEACTGRRTRRSRRMCTPALGGLHRSTSSCPTASCPTASCPTDCAHAIVAGLGRLRVSPPGGPFGDEGTAGRRRTDHTAVGSAFRLVPSGFPTAC